MRPDERLALFERDGLRVHAVIRSDRALVFEGQDLLNGREYEYFVTVSPDQVPMLMVALAGQPGQGILALLAAHAEEVACRGEVAWLEDKGITPKVATWGSWF